MNNLFRDSLYAGVTLSLMAYMLGFALKKRFRLGIFNPLLISIAISIVVLLVGKIDYEVYNESAKYLGYLLTPATGCLAIPLYEQWELLKKNYLAVLLGLLAGYVGGALDMVLMRFTDMVMSFPYILLILVASVIFKPGLWSIILIFGFVDWPGVARLVRGSILSIKEQDYVKSSQIAGMPRSYILFSDILPNVMTNILVFATTVMATSILDEAALSFLGMGIQPPAASLGNMLNGAESVTVLTGMPWLWISPGLVIIILVVCVNFVGDALRDALDPTAVV